MGWRKTALLPTLHMLWWDYEDKSGTHIVDCLVIKWKTENADVDNDLHWDADFSFNDASGADNIPVL